MNVLPSFRVLIVDDNPSIHDDFVRVLAPSRTGADFDAEADALFGAATAASDPAMQRFELESALQGQEAREKVVSACAAGRPFALAFVDMRMPPGWDGLTTILKLWEIDRDLHVVICTAHSDRSWEEIETALTQRDRWAVLKKPFDKIEVLQLAHVLAAKWQQGRSVGV
jgi:two-component system NtrC family sensor kinase